MGAVLPLDLAGIDEPKIGLVYQRAGLKRVPGPFTHHVYVREAVQLVVDQRDKLAQGRLISAAPILKQESHFLRGVSRHDIPLLIELPFPIWPRLYTRSSGGNSYLKASV
jgi:hypothetical protein